MMDVLIVWQSYEIKRVKREAQRSEGCEPFLSAL